MLHIKAGVIYHFYFIKMSYMFYALPLVRAYEKYNSFEMNAQRKNKILLVKTK